MIRLLKREDLTEEYFDLLEQLSHTDFSLRVTNELVNKTYSEYINEKNLYIYVYDKGERIIGTVSVFIEPKILHYGSKVGHLEDLVIDQNFRQSGIGKELIDHCISFCKQQNCYKISLSCSDNNVKYYQMFGFKKYENSMRKDLI